MMTRLICHTVPPTAGSSTLHEHYTYFAHTSVSMICTATPKSDVAWVYPECIEVVCMSSHVCRDCVFNIVVYNVCPYTRMWVLLLFVESETRFAEHSLLARIPPCSEYTNLTFIRCIAVYVYVLHLQWIFFLPGLVNTSGIVYNVPWSMCFFCHDPNRGKIKG